MEDNEAARLIETYIEGWKKKDPDAILAVLSPDCIVREAHGSTYTGIAVITRWVEGWFAAGNTVDRWEITSFHFVGEVAFIEWHFACTSEGQVYEFDGASLAKFTQGKITELHEYQMTKPSYEWSPQ